MALDVRVNISLLKPVGNAGFGYPLILAAQIGEGANPVAYTECTSLEEVASAGFAQETDVYRAANLLFMQENAPTKIAVCSTKSKAISELPNLAGKGWRQLIVIDAQIEDYATEIPAYIETTDKLYFATVATAPTEAKNFSEYDRTVAFVYATEDYGKLAVAAVVGATAGYVAGAITYKNMIIKGLTAQKFSATELAAMHEHGGFTVVEKVGDIVTSEGIVGSGEFVDIIDCTDWIVQQLTYQTQKTMHKMPKVPFDNNGIGILEGVAINVLRTAYNNDMIADNEDGTPAYAIDYALKSECDVADIAARRYIGGKFSFVLKGAIHNVEINGEISVA